MKILKNSINVDGFLRKIAIAPKNVILLDYDGTLAPFRKNREKAVPYIGIREILTKLIDLDNCRTIIVSGRTVKDIHALLNLDKYPEIWGCHGAERITSDGDYTTIRLPSETREALNEATLAMRQEGVWNNCEEKYSSLALHWRGLPAVEIKLIKTRTKKIWNDIIKGKDLTISEFDGGIEIRPKGITKGTAVEFILNQYPHGLPVIYMGDDFTDEDAFRVLKGKGLSILVKSEYRPTEADIWIKPPDELLEFLSNLVRVFGENNEKKH
ncbi:trehalose-phosphatase [bacterium]|nr:trehalose-phosphatase [bacterium]